MVFKNGKRITQIGNIKKLFPPLSLWEEGGSPKQEICEKTGEEARSQYGKAICGVLLCSQCAPFFPEEREDLTVATTDRSLCSPDEARLFDRSIFQEALDRVGVAF